VLEYTADYDQEEETDLFRLKVQPWVKSLYHIRTLYTVGCDQELTSGNPWPVPDIMSV